MRLSKLDEIAKGMYERQASMSAGMTPDTLEIQPWHKLTRSTKDYWRGMAQVALDIFAKPNPDMIEAVLDNMRQPIIIKDNATWEEVRTEQFTKWWTLALEAAK